MASGDVDEADDGFVCGPCQRGRCSRCNSTDCCCCYGGDPEPWPPLFERVLRLLRRLRGPALPYPT